MFVADCIDTNTTIIKLNVSEKVLYLSADMFVWLHHIEKETLTEAFLSVSKPSSQINQISITMFGHSLTL